jgi:oxygen-independent coproporphyrinogen-3 oxidase
MSGPSLEGVAPPISLYVHFPFCVQRCHYCDFSVHRTGTPPLEEWLECIEREADDWVQRAGWAEPVRLETLFVGGGTPSLMGDSMSRLSRILSRRFALDTDSHEWTAESNPASLEAAVVEAWLEAGVNRLSLGVQSFDDEVLRWLGRLHDAAGARRALSDARAAGFENLNVDLIFGLPASIERDWDSEVEAALQAGVTHVSAYGLTAEPRTPLGRRVAAGEVVMAGGERYAAEYLSAVAALEEAGFVHYEVSNFAIPGRECRHNWHYWDGSPYLGLGPSAHSYLDGTRTWNVFRWEAYRVALMGGGRALEDHETVGAGESRLERLWLALRTNRGLPAGDPLAREVMAGAGDLVRTWSEAGWLTVDESRIRFTAEGWLRMDELVAALSGRAQATVNGNGLREGDDVPRSDRA